MGMLADHLLSSAFAAQMPATSVWLFQIIYVQLNFEQFSQLEFSFGKSITCPVFQLI